MRPATVLVVDDSRTVRAVLRRHLEAAGYTVEEQDDGEGALARSRSHPPDVVLLDLEMPGIGGRAALDAFQADDVLRAVPVVVLSGHRDVGLVVDALEAGAHDFLAKPFEPAELLARVRSAARVKALTDELRRRNHELELFAERASHDLKSPLTVMKGMADTLESSGEQLDPALRLRLLDRISASASRASQMVTDLLTLARQEAAPDEVAPTTDLAEVVAHLTSHDPPSDSVIEVTGHFGRVAAPRPDVVSMVANLIDNASHYGRGADGVLRLHITGFTEEGVQILDIHDEGPGIAASDRAAVFEPFYRGESSLAANPSSTGIGLAIVAGAASRWGGSVSVGDPPPGESGAWLRVKLPLVPGLPAPPA